MKIKKVEDCIKEAKERGYDEIAIIGSEIWSKKEKDKYWELVR